MVKSRQAGSVTSFIVVGGILVLVTAGLLYWAGNRQVATDSQGGSPEVSLPIASDNQTSNDGQGSNETSSDQGVSGKDSPDSSSQQTPGATQGNGSGNQDKTPSDQEKNEDDELPTTPKELSHTGPVEDIIGVIGLGVLTASIVVFLQSRRRDATL